MATFNSHPRRRATFFLLIISLILWTLAIPGSVRGQTNNSPANDFAAKDLAAYHHARALYLADPDNPTNAWQFARACFNVCDYAATNNDQRASFARQGIAAANNLISRNPQSVQGHYYLAMNMGELAEAEAPSFTSFHLVHEMEREFKTAETLDKYFDYGGPARNLGLLYRDAPGWPLSIGSKHKARELLEEAASIAPDFPENDLNLAETFLRWKDKDAARKELNALDALWSNAQKQYTGPAWDDDWRDWTARRAALRAKLDGND